MKIKNTTELAAAVSNGDTIESVSRAIYKGTECGAWADERSISSKKQTRFKVRIRESVVGLSAVQWQLNGRGAWHYFDGIVPQDLLHYLGGPEPTLAGPFKRMLKIYTEHKTLAELRKSTEETCRKNITWLPRKQDTCWITLDVDYPRPGIGIGSIVEGVDEGTEVQELAFPFTDKEFWTAVQAVEDEARSIWNDTHGCGYCWGGTGESEGDEESVGNGPVDPNCTHCGGKGEAY